MINESNAESNDNNQTTNNEDNNITFDLHTIFDLFQSIGAIGTAIAVYFVWQEYRQTRSEMEGTLRPWIGLSKKITYNEEGTFVTGTFKNFGRLPGKIYYGKQIVEQEKIDIRTMISTDYVGKNARIIRTDLNLSLFPDADVEVNFYVEETRASWLGYFIEYSYAKRQKGIYAIVWRYNKEDKHFYREDELFE